MKTTEQRFWAKVERRGPDACWPWIAARVQSYGRFSLQHQMLLAHRVAWVLERGPIPDGLCVLHRCDNPPCVNPAHLFLGTQADNNADRDAKGRVQRYNAAKTHCKHGHEFAGRNLIVTPKGERQCRACHIRWKRARRAAA